IAVPVESERAHAAEHEPGLLAQLAPRRALETLPRLHEAARQVEPADLRRVRAPPRQHRPPLEDDHARARAGIVVDEIAAARAADLERVPARDAPDRSPAARARKRAARPHRDSTAITTGSSA